MQKITMMSCFIIVLHWWFEAPEPLLKKLETLAAPNLDYIFRVMNKEIFSFELQIVLSLYRSRIWERGITGSSILPPIGWERKWWL